MFHMVDEQNSPAWARVCDLIFQDRRDDLAYYLEQASAKGASVLEIGCATGRITEFLVACGKAVHAIDPSAEMLSIARNKIGKISNPNQVSFGESSISELNIGSDRKFSLVVIPSSAFMSICSSTEQQIFLDNVKRHLSLEGTLIIEMKVPDPSIILGDPATVYHLGDINYEQDGSKLVLYQQTDYDDFEQTGVCKVIVEFVDSEGIVGQNVVHDLSFRYTFRWEMFHLLRNCGFEIVSLLGDFHGNAFDMECDSMIWTAKARA